MLTYAQLLAELFVLTYAQLLAELFVLSTDFLISSLDTTDCLMYQTIESTVAFIRSNLRTN